MHANYKHFIAPLIANTINSNFMNRQNNNTAVRLIRDKAEQTLFVGEWVFPNKYEIEANKT